MSLIFSISEGIKSMKKARLASTLSISSMSLTILLIGIFVVTTLNISNFVGFIREKIEIELFVDVTAEQKDIDGLESSLRNIRGVESFRYISKEEAAQRFKKEFGEDIQAVLNYNPLPASFIITLEKSHRTPDAAGNLKSRLEKLPSVDEVVYQKPLLEKLDRYLNILIIGVLAIGIIIVIIASVLINNTVRLSMYARRDMIQIMRLVGATEGFIRRPFIVEGIVQGFLGAIIACVILYYSCRLIETLLYANLTYNMPVFYSLVIFGIFIGMISAFFSVNKYLRNI